MNHTPGPWYWASSCSWRRLSSNAGDGDVMFPTKQRDGHPDCSFPNGGFTGPDARLIASSPELLEALQRLSEQCDRLRLPGQRETEAEKNAKAVIAKVLGQ